MRKRSTFEELASATLVKQKINPAPLPYSSPHDNTFAVMELGQMADRLKQERENAEDARYAEVHAARNLGVTPEHLRQMAEGIITAGSRMHEDTRAQAQHHDAASQRRFRLFADGYLQDEAERRRAAAQQQRTAEEIKSSLRGTTSSASAAAAAAQEGMSGPAAATTPSGGFQTPQGAAPGTPQGAPTIFGPKPAAAPPGDPAAGPSAAAVQELTPEENAALAAFTKSMEGEPETPLYLPTHKPKPNLSKNANKEALQQQRDAQKQEQKQHRVGVTAALLKEAQEAQKHATARAAGEATSSGATSSATGHLGATGLLEGGASSSGGAQTTLPEHSRDKNDASKATHDRKSGTQAAGSSGAGKGKPRTSGTQAAGSSGAGKGQKPRTTKSRGRSLGATGRRQGGRQTRLNSASESDSGSPSQVSGGTTGVKLKPGPGVRIRSRSTHRVVDGDL